MFSSHCHIHTRRDGHDVTDESSSMGSIFLDVSSAILVLFSFFLFALFLGTFDFLVLLSISVLELDIFAFSVAFLLLLVLVIVTLPVLFFLLQYCWCRFDDWFNLDVFDVIDA